MCVVRKFMGGRLLGGTGLVISRNNDTDGDGVCGKRGGNWDREVDQDFPSALMDVATGGVSTFPSTLFIHIY